MTVQEFYSAVGGNYADAANRLQNDTLILKFLRMLPQDTSMAMLTQAMEKGDAGTAFRAVHTLKGISLNLSLTPLAEVCRDMTEALRGQSQLPEGIQPLYEAVALEHRRVLEALDQLC